MNDKLQKQTKRKKRVRGKIFGTKEKPRLSVFRSNRFLYAQLIDDANAKTLVSVCEKHLKQEKGDKKAVKMDKAGLIGEMLAQKAKAKKIKNAVFDRGAYKYHGRVKSLAEGARKGGLKF